MITTSETPPTVHDSSVRRAVAATYLSFGGAGFLIASWAARIPQIRDRLGLEPSELGLVLLSLAVGSLVSLAYAGPLITAVGPAKTVKLMAMLVTPALVTVGVGYRVGVVPVTIGLFMIGLSAGAWDVGINVHGAAVETRVGSSLMPRFHAGFSLGTVAGALLGTLAVAAKVSVTVHLCLVAIAVSAAVIVATTQFLHDVEPDASEDTNGSTVAAPFGARDAWSEPRTLLIGVIALAFAFAEGVANDWIAVSLVDGHDAPEAIGTLALAVFLAAMTLARWFGPGMIDRYGRVRLLRATAGCGIVGAGIFIVAPVPAVAFAGVVLWGFGASLGFPIAMSAGADEPRVAARRVSVVSSIGYCAFLAGPPLIGFVGDHLGVVQALTFVPAMLVVATLVAGAAAPLTSAKQATDTDGGSGRTEPMNSAHRGVVEAESVVHGVTGQGPQLR
ncbi:MAG: MFS transporter [Acidimicrobiales bacterium]